MNPVTVNAGGFTGEQTGYFLNYSIGESASIVDFRNAYGTALTTGFIQAVLSATILMPVLPINASQVSVGPNPASSFVRIRTFFTSSGKLQIQVFDNTSVARFLSGLLVIQGNYEKQINITHYLPGVYYVRILFKSDSGPSVIGMYTIIKL
ncbi:MAG: hypothetical protein ABI581_16820 [Sediminibacterium sp.]